MQPGSAAFHELSGDSTLQWAREKWRWNKESDFIAYAAYAPLFSLDSLAHMVHCLSGSRRDCELYHNHKTETKTVSLVAFLFSSCRQLPRWGVAKRDFRRKKSEACRILQDYLLFLSNHLVGVDRFLAGMVRVVPAPMLLDSFSPSLFHWARGGCLSTQRALIHECFTQLHVIRLLQMLV